MTARYPAFADDILAHFAACGAELVDVAVIQPADPFLDMAGEDLRRRIFLTESETGETLCLRPEFTIPVCMDHIANRAGTPRRYAYLGEVFRQRREGGAEFFQAGIEDLGVPDTAEADARSIADAYALIARVLPNAPLTVTLGDQRVFEAVLAALGLPRGWQKRLLAPSARRKWSGRPWSTSPPRRKRRLSQMMWPKWSMRQTGRPCRPMWPSAWRRPAYRPMPGARRKRSPRA